MCKLRVRFDRRKLTHIQCSCATTGIPQCIHLRALIVLIEGDPLVTREFTLAFINARRTDWEQHYERVSVQYPDHRAVVFSTSYKTFFDRDEEQRVRSRKPDLQLLHVLRTIPRGQNISPTLPNGVACSLKRSRVTNYTSIPSMAPFMTYET